MNTYIFKNAALGTLVCFSLNSAAMPSQAAPAKGQQRITITIDGNGYTPSSVNVKAGRPVQLTFVSKGESCANTISFPSLKKTISLQKGDKKSVTYTPEKGQILAYSCGMQMFKGKVVAR